MRIVISVVVVAAIGVSIWYFAFRPDIDISTFNQLTSIKKYESSVNLSKTINNIADTVSLSRTDAVTLAKEKSFVNGGDTTVKNSNTNNGYVLSYTFDSLKLSLDYYYPYTQMADGVKSSVQKSVTSNLKNYNNKLVTLVDKLNYAWDYEKGSVYDSTVPSTITELAARYDNVAQAFENVNTSLTNLNNSVRSFVISYVFDGSMVYDSKTATFDIINTASYYHYNKTTNYDLLQNVLSRYEGNTNFMRGSDAGVSISYNASQILAAYNDLVNNTNSSGDRLFDYLFQLTDTKYNEVRDDLSVAKSTFGDSHGENVQIIMAVIGG